MNATTNNTPAEPTIDYKKKYEETNEASSAGLHNPIAKGLSEKVLSSFYDVTVPKAELNLQNQIKQAAAIGDFDTLEALMSQRKEIKTNQAKDGNIIKEIRKHDFPLVLKAFRAEFDTIIYEIAYNVLTGTHKAITEASKSTKGTRSTKAASSDDSDTAKRKSSKYVITMKDGTVVDFPVKKGPTGGVDFNFSKDAYAALGYEVKKDGEEYVVEPGTIELIAGGEIPVNRSNLVDAIKNQTAEKFKGWTVEKVTID